MMDITGWTDNFLISLRALFGQRLWFAGLQGSYARGEATGESDIDLVVILDTLEPKDIRAYQAMLDALPGRDKLCGFLCGKQELLAWEPADLFQLYHDTKPLFGDLRLLLEKLDDKAVKRAIKIGACNLYHGCVHNMLYTQSEDILRGLYKSAAFTAQAICFQQTGQYIRRQQDVLRRLQGRERAILQTALDLKNGAAVEFDAMSDALFAFARHWVINE